MKKALVTSLLVTFLLCACTSKSSGSKKKTSNTPTSLVSATSKTSKSLTSNSGVSGGGIIDESHFKTFNITPTGSLYSHIDETISFKTSFDPGVTKIPAEEAVISYSLSNTAIATLTVNENQRDATVTCNAIGTTVLTAKSFDESVVRTVTIKIIDSSTSDSFQFDLSTDAKKKAAKEVFGWTSDNKNGNSSGTSTLGNLTWNWTRSKPAEIGTYSVALKFGATGDDKNEGAMTFQTTFSRQVSSIVIECSSTGATVDGVAMSYGSATIDAKFGDDDYLAREISGTTYAKGVECHTPKFSTVDAPNRYVNPVTILCENKTGQFTFSFGESGAATYLKSILVIYAE